MISDKMNDALNSQVNKEMFSSNLYLAMSAWLNEHSLPGFAHWMRIQAEEEYVHCMKIYDYILERGGSLKLGTIPGPEVRWKSALEVVEEVVAHEAMVTGLINELMDVALEVKDHAAAIFLQWFVSEQVEEEDNVGDLLARMKMVGDDSTGLFALDMELSKRVLVPPAN